MKIYTKTGDQGLTSLGTGDKVRKDHHLVDAYGTVDELSSFIGLAESVLTNQVVTEDLLWIQRRLFKLAGSLAFKGHNDMVEVTADDIAFLEAAIDKLSGDLPPLQDFILPGGQKAAALLHVSRSICRRTERLVTTVDQECGSVQKNILPFLNRLSDYLFVAARYVNKNEGVSEHLASE